MKKQTYSFHCDLILVFLLFFCTNCHSNNRSLYTLQRNQPIVDYPQSYEQNKRILHSDKNAVQKTQFVYNRRRVSEKEFKRILKTGKISKIVIIKDQHRLDSLKLSENNIEQAVIAEK